MGTNLIGYGGNMRFSGGSWSWILQLASEYGWKPQGTKPSAITKELGIKKWDGNYFSNLYQFITKKDAKNMARALEKALIDIPNKANRKAQRREKHGDERGIIGLDYWSGKRGKTYIKKFIKFCKAGRFCVS